MQYINKQVDGTINKNLTGKVTFIKDKDYNTINSIKIKLEPKSHNLIKTKYPNINKENINNDSSIFFKKVNDENYYFYTSYFIPYNFINKDDIESIDYDNDNQTLVITMSTKYKSNVDEKTPPKLKINIDLINKDKDDELLSKINFNSKIEQIKLRIRNDINDIPTLENIKEILEKLQKLEEQKGGYKHNNLLLKGGNDDIKKNIDNFNKLLDTNITKDDLPYIKSILEELRIKIDKILKKFSHSTSSNKDDNKKIIIIAIAVIVLILLFVLFKKLKKQKTKK